MYQKNFKCNVRSTLLSLFVLIVLFGCDGGGGGSSDDSNTNSSPTLSSITINPFDEKIKAGASQQLTVTASYTDSSTADVSTNVTWSSSQSSIASISTNGELNASAAGKTVVTAILDGKQDSINIDIINLVDLSVSPVELTLAKDSLQQYTATGRYSDNSIEDLTQAVFWSTDNTNISDNGLLTATTTGTSIITANIDNNSSSTSLTISSAELKLITINTSSLILKGVSEQLGAIGFFSDGTTQDISNLVTWSSSNSSIASIDETTGLLASLETGNVIITASTNNLFTTANIEISDATLTEVVVTPATLSLAKGSSTTISVIAIFSDQSFVDISNQVDWSNSDTSKVEILTGNPSFENDLLAKDIGSATLTAVFSGFEAVSQITVTDAILTELNISPANTSIPIGLSQRFIVSGLYSDGSLQDLSTQVTWISSNITFATIDNATPFEGVAHALGEGVAVISATLGNITQSANFEITTAQLKSIEIQPVNQTIPVGLNFPIKAIGIYSDGSQLEITDTVEWSASTSDVVSLTDSKNGLLHTLEEGTTLINASVNGISGLGEIFVTSASLESISISTPLPIIPQGFQQQLLAIGTFSDNTTAIITQQVTWKSNNTLFATVDNALTPGLLQTTNIGEVAISASLNNITSEVEISITEAIINQITTSVEQSSLGIKTTTKATAIASFSDNSLIDVTQWVNWTSSSSNIASVSNTNQNKGIVSAHSTGITQLTALLNGISSQSIAIEVIETPNTPISLSIGIFPNVILNDASDNTQLQATVSSAAPDGSIPDSTQVKFTITEGTDIRTETAYTDNSVATVSLSSDYEGLIEISATVVGSAISGHSALYSTSSLENVILVAGINSATYQSPFILKDSLFAIFTRNLSNREFKTDNVFITTYIETRGNLNLPDSPVASSSNLFDDTLSAGEFSILVYRLDGNLQNNNLSITYEFRDETSDSLFYKGYTNTF